MSQINFSNSVFKWFKTRQLWHIQYLP